MNVLDSAVDQPSPQKEASSFYKLKNDIGESETGISKFIVKLKEDHKDAIIMESKAWKSLEELRTFILDPEKAEKEQRRAEREKKQLVSSYLSSPYLGDPRMAPSLVESKEGSSEEEEEERELYSRGDADKDDSGIDTTRRKSRGLPQRSQFLRLDQF